MRNLVFAALGLVIVITVIFLFASKQDNKKDTLIPDQKELESPKLGLSTKSNESSKSAMKKQYAQAPSVLSAEQIKGKKVRIKTDKGDIVIALLETSPLASSNFIFLVKDHFYDNIVFHRVIKGFMIQGGDPEGIGTGGPGYQFADELVTLDYKRGVVAMANAGPNTNGSQFFIMHQDYKLPKNYTIFGNVISGMDVVDTIADSQVDQNDKPLQPVVMKTVTIEN